MPLKAGSKNRNDDFINSMAEAMEKAFEAEWPHIMGSEALPPSNEQMQLLFIAIAQGIVRHLVENPGSFNVQTDSTSHAGKVSNISTTGTLY